MSIRTTNDRAVALYDSVDGIAFGPTFESRDHALDYLRLAPEIASRLYPGAYDLEKPWVWHRDVHRKVYDEWFKERVDGESGVLLELDFS
jgi:hypothetical protein